MKNTIITKKILKCDEVNANNVLIPSEVVEKYLETVDPNTRFFCTIDPHVNISASDISHALYNLRIEDSYLVGEIEILKTLQGQILEDTIMKFGDLIYFPAQYMATTSISRGVNKILKISDIKCFVSSSQSAFK